METKKMISCIMILGLLIFTLTLSGCSEDEKDLKAEVDVLEAEYRYKGGDSLTYPSTGNTWLYLEVEVKNVNSDDGIELASEDFKLKTDENINYNVEDATDIPNVELGVEGDVTFWIGFQISEDESAEILLYESPWGEEYEAEISEPYPLITGTFSGTSKMVSGYEIDFATMNRDFEVNRLTFKLQDPDGDIGTGNFNDNSHGTKTKVIGYTLTYVDQVDNGLINSGDSIKIEGALKAGTYTFAMHYTGVELDNVSFRLTSTLVEGNFGGTDKVGNSAWKVTFDEVVPDVGVSELEFRFTYPNSTTTINIIFESDADGTTKTKSGFTFTYNDMMDNSVVNSGDSITIEGIYPGSYTFAMTHGRDELDEISFRCL